jgi:SulP family sulfate permease
LRKVTIDVTEAHLWDITAVGALDKIVLKYRRQGVDVAVIGVNEASAHMLDRFALHDKDMRPSPRRGDTEMQRPGASLQA